MKFVQRRMVTSPLLFNYFSIENSSRKYWASTILWSVSLFIRVKKNILFFSTDFMNSTRNFALCSTSLYQLVTLNDWCFCRCYFATNKMAVLKHNKRQCFVFTCIYDLNVINKLISCSIWFITFALFIF